jgi:hypothetical protein
MSLLLAAPAAAQGPGPGRPGGEGPGGPREELGRMVDAYVISNLQEGLGLSDEQFVRLLPLVKRLQSDRRGYVEKRMGVLQEMRRTLESGRGSEARLGELLRDLKSLDAEEPTLIRKDMDAIDAQLGTEQQAKLRIFLAQVEQRLRGLAGRIRQGERPGPGGQRRPGEPRD